jgi:hypothetical protein
VGKVLVVNIEYFIWQGFCGGNWCRVNPGAIEYYVLLISLCESSTAQTSEITLSRASLGSIRRHNSLDSDILHGRSPYGDTVTGTSANAEKNDTLGIFVGQGRCSSGCIILSRRSQTTLTLVTLVTLRP